MDIQTIANSTFNSEHSVMGLHKLLLTEEEHKALTDTLKNHEKLKEEHEALRKACAKHKHDFADLWKKFQDLKEEYEAVGEACLRHKHAFADLWKIHQDLKEEYAEAEWNEGLNFHQRLANGERCE